MANRKYSLLSGLFLSYFILSITNFAFGFVAVRIDRINIINANYIGVGLIEIFSLAVCAFLIILSSIILAKAKDRNHSGRAVMLFASISLTSIYSANFFTDIALLCSNLNINIASFIRLILILAASIVSLCLLKKGYSAIGRIILIVIESIAAIANIIVLCLSSGSGARAIIYQITTLLFTILSIVCLVRRKPIYQEVKQTTEDKADPEPSQREKADLIRKYKELLDKGAITQEEYDQKKKELL